MNKGQIQAVPGGYGFLPEGESQPDHISPSLYRLADWLIMCEGFTQDEAWQFIDEYKAVHDAGKEP